MDIRRGVAYAFSRTQKQMEYINKKKTLFADMKISRAKMYMLINCNHLSVWHFTCAVHDYEFNNARCKCVTVPIHGYGD